MEILRWQHDRVRDAGTLALGQFRYRRYHPIEEQLGYTAGQIRPGCFRILRPPRRHVSDKLLQFLDRNVTTRQQVPHRPRVHEDVSTCEDDNIPRRTCRSIWDRVGIFTQYVDGWGHGGDRMLVAPIRRGLGSLRSPGTYRDDGRV